VAVSFVERVFVDDGHDLGAGGDAASISVVDLTRLAVPDGCRVAGVLRAFVRIWAGWGASFAARVLLGEAICCGWPVDRSVAVSALTARCNRIFRVGVVVDVRVTAVRAKAEDVRAGVGEVDAGVGFDDAATPRTHQIAIGGRDEVSAAAG